MNPTDIGVGGLVASLALVAIAVAISRWWVTAVTWRPSGVLRRNQRRPTKARIATVGRTSNW
mgnify:CR=1 FL=1